MAPMGSPQLGSASRRHRILVAGGVVVAGLGGAAALLDRGGAGLVRALMVACFMALLGIVLRLAARHREAERRLESALDFQRQMIDQIPIPVFYKDANRIYLGCNRAYEKLMGVDRSQVIGKTVFDVAPPELARTYDEQDRQLLEARGLQVYRSLLARGDVRRDVVFHKATFDLPGGLPGGIIGAIQDLTEQGEAQDRAEALAHELQVLFHTVPMGLLRVVGRTIIWANRAMEELSGYPAGDLAGRSTRVLYASDERFEAVGREIYETLKAGRRFRAVEDLVREDGSRRWIEFTGMALSPAEPLESFWALDDVTDRRLAEERLAQNVEQLREALQKVKTLTGLLPVCSSCKKIRDEAGRWNPMEAYISNRTEAGFTHGICPECAERFRSGQ